MQYKATTLLSMILMIVILVNPILISNVWGEGRGVLIVTTFPNLVRDVQLLTCSNDVVVSLVPQGVDPHTYTLKPDDISLLKKADLIISTGHAPFEINIRDLHEKGIIQGVLVEIPRIPGIVLFKNPATGKYNYHMPIYDPFNYMKFLGYIEKVLEKINPSCKDMYRRKLYSVFYEITPLLTNSSIINISAVADLPYTIYAVEWLGINVKYLIVKEQGVQASPQDLMIIEREMNEKNLKLCIITHPVLNPASKKLLTLCRTHNISVIYVPSPLTNSTFIEKEIYIVKQLHSIMGSIGNQTRIVEENRFTIKRFGPTYIDLLLLILASALLVSIIILLGGRRI